MKISANRVTRIDWRIGLDADEVAAHGRIDGGLNAFSSLIIHERVDPEEPDEREILALVVRDWSRGTERILYGAEDPSVRSLLQLRQKMTLTPAITLPVVPSVRSAAVLPVQVNA